MLDAVVNQPSRAIEPKHFAILLPVFDDWPSFGSLLKSLDTIAKDHQLKLSIVAVNDGSNLPLPADFGADQDLPNLHHLEIINLVCNLGHQQAIAIGLSLLSKRGDHSAILVMDSDGEDSPDDIPQLLADHNNNTQHVVLAERISRSEGPVFNAFYFIYKIIFRTLTGQKISSGNFCVIPIEKCRQLTYMSNLWNSLPATILSSRIPHRLVPTHRAKRLFGSSKLNFVGLVLHGLQAITVFAEAVAVRLSLLILAMITVAAVIVAGTRIWTDIFVPGWASSMIGILAIIGVQTLFLWTFTSMVVLKNRSLMQMIPAIQYTIYVKDVLTLFSRNTVSNTLDSSNS